ncbi:membrane integrity-associated transporter subunit PqiC [Pseudomonas sp. 5P_3.1_Bac2]|uniref:PqiC family protein n=1 Tax=Pseudomonas sp. 5P_3.1_Bac2 TaxID=2971617 RepID=UPI0021C82E78|nr:ABC-type transport auxiliary lipoprotein family protein [Pseudomonas sp. 5P_3.1_Bac2]MCU1718309.1 ABC-type transport auxiliary lipoprotein family protein [Pseudomonas sp. 5P_3.1_Bac2]
MTALRFSGSLVLAGVLMITGCTRYQQESLYQLDSGNISVPTSEQGIALLLGPVTIADYLQRDQLLQRQVDGSLTTADNARWAGSLASEIDQQVLRQLASRLNSQRLVLAPAAAGFVPQARLNLSITRLDSGPQRPAVLEAQWRLAGADGKLLDGRLVSLEAEHDGTIVDQVRAQSEVLQQLVLVLAKAVESNRPEERPAVRVAKPKVSTPVKVTPIAPPQIPVVEPQRVESEVFRF